jgi:hypothetical protein
LRAGQVLLDASPREAFGRGEPLRAAGLVPPQITRLAQRLAPCGLPADVLTVEEFVRAYAGVHSTHGQGGGGMA